MLRAVIMILGLAGAAAATAGDAALRPDLERAARLRVFFGHQSVGANVLDGVRELAREAGLEVKIAEALVGQNRDPASKLKAFAQALETRPGGVDVALVKFCYLDIDAATDADALFARYRAAIEALQARHPATSFVHVTAPLTTVQGGATAFVKKLLARAPWGTVENVRRERYNALLRKAYGGREPIFDLARVESEGPDGVRATVQWDGSVVPALAPAFTDDGGHLNAAGKRRAARELLAVLAALAERRAPAAAAR